MEMAREKGTQMRRAKNEVKSVPTRKGSAPNVLATGSHVLPNKKERPKALIEGREYRRRLTKVPPSRTATARAERKIVF